MKSLLLTILTLSSSLPGLAQTLQIGPVLGNMWQHKEGRIQVDSILIQTQTGRDNLLLIGAFAEYDLIDWLSFQTSVTGVNNGISLMATEPVNSYCNIPPCRTNRATGYFTLTSTNTMVISWYMAPRVRFYGIGGFSLNAHFVPQFDESVIPATPGGWIIRELYVSRSIKPITTAYTYGLGLEAWRFSLQAQVSQSIGTQGILRDFTYQGTIYPSYSWAGYLTLMLAYQFDWPCRSSGEAVP